MTALDLSTEPRVRSEGRDYFILALMAVIMVTAVFYAREAVTEGGRRESERRFALARAQDHAALSGFGVRFTGVYFVEEELHAEWIGDHGVSCNLLVVPAPSGEPRGYKVAWDTQRSVPDARNDPSILGCYETSG